MKIEFTPVSEFAQEVVLPPVPAINSIPVWYKETKTFINEKGVPLDFNKEVNVTVKRCLPFFDAMSAGYFILLPCDVVINKSETDAGITWLSSLEIVGFHSLSQIGEMSIPSEFYKNIYKWNSYWTIKTAPGYSTLFVHPLNRNDLPFNILSGIVDTDTYNIPVQFPFLLRKDFSGIIPKGTPIAQAIPIKRENWISKKNVFEDKNKFNLEKIRTYAQHGYKKMFWHKKTYR
jgi:hypothetical protein